MKEQGDVRERRPVFGSAEMDLTSYDKQFQQQIADTAVQQAKDKVEAIKKEIAALQEEYGKLSGEPSGGSTGKVVTPGTTTTPTTGKATTTPAADEARPYLEAQHTLEDYDKAIAYHRELQRTASQEGYQEHQKEIQALEEARKAFTGEAKPESPPARVHGHRELHPPLGTADGEQHRGVHPPGVQRPASAADVYPGCGGPRDDVRPGRHHQLRGERRPGTHG